MKDGCQWVIELVKQITYKPGWKLAVEGNLLIVLMLVEDARPEDSGLTLQKGDAFIVRFTEQIPLEMDERDSLHWIFESVGRAEDHERREWFKFKGHRTFDPH